MKTPLACSKCDSTELFYEVTNCVECETPTCCDCKNPIAQELETCGDEDCALKAIKRIQNYRDQLFTRSLAHDRGLPTIPVVEFCNDSPIEIPARKVA